MKQTQHQTLKKRKAQAELWRRGNLAYVRNESDEPMLDSNQLGMRDAFYSSTAQQFVFLCSRQIGKTHLTVVLANEFAIRNPGSRILYVTATTEDARDIVPTQMRNIQETAPSDCRAEHKVQQNKFVFPNRSEIHFMGLDRRPDKPRGRAYHFIIVDEAGFMNHLKKAVDGALMPTLTTTGGRILFATTPPDTPDHEFVPILEAAAASGNLVKRTIWDCPRFSRDQVLKMCEDAGGEQSVAWRRERLCEIVRDADATVIPEFTEERAKQLVQEVPQPAFFDAYVGMDPAFTDNTGVVFGYWDFVNARLVIEDEILLSQATDSTIAGEIKATEARLWGDRPPLKRVGDSADPKTLNNFTRDHGLRFQAIKKTHKDVMVNQLRLLVSDGKLVINPRCKNLISQLLYCRWQGNSRKEFARTAAFGHFDLVDALIYLILSLSRNRNPIPQGIGISSSTHFIPPDYFKEPSQTQLEKLIPPRLRVRKVTRRRSYGR